MEQWLLRKNYWNQEHKWLFDGHEVIAKYPPEKMGDGECFCVFNCVRGIEFVGMLKFWAHSTISQMVRKDF